MRGEVALARLRLASALVQGGDPVLADPVERLGHRLQAGGVAAEAAEEVLDPRDEQVGVGRGRCRATLRNASVGKRRRELRDEVAFALRCDILDELPAESSHRRLGCIHRTRREPRVDDSAVLDVVGRVDLRRHEPVDRVGLPRRDRLAGEQLRCLVDVAHGVVAREDPVALRERVEVDRGRLAELVAQLPVPARRLVGSEVAMHDRATAQVALDRLIVVCGVGHVDLLNLGMATSSETCSKVTSRGIPIQSSSFAQPDDVRRDAHALVKLDDGDVVRHLLREGRVVHLVHEREAVERAPTRWPAPTRGRRRSTSRSGAAAACRSRPSAT